MRVLRNKERTQRGCIYCTDVIPPEKEGKIYRKRMCPHEECPYHELDDVKEYDEYLKKTRANGLMRVLLG